MSLRKIYISILYVQFGLLIFISQQYHSFRAAVDATFVYVNQVKLGTCTFTGQWRTTDQSKSFLLKSMKELGELESNYGRQGYWNEFYEQKEEFSWYSPWSDIAPFFMELVPLESNGIFSSPPKVLLPGIGNDSSMANMYDDGYTHLTAFDYAEEGIACAKKFFGSRWLVEGRYNNQNNRKHVDGVDLHVADARNLPFDSDTFDAVLEKGTLDAVYLSGGKDKEIASEHLNMAIKELSRVVRQGGVVMSISAACADSIQSAFNCLTTEWEVIKDGGFYITEDGYASNNVDATIFAWKKR